MVTDPACCRFGALATIIRDWPSKRLRRANAGHFHLIVNPRDGRTGVHARSQKLGG